MSQRDSGYERKERDCYETPEWVTLAVANSLRDGKDAAIWEPACGSGKMTSALRVAGFQVIASDIETGKDFLLEKMAPPFTVGIVTNPPYVLAQKFIEHAIWLMRPFGYVAMLLRTDFDHAKTRKHLFGNHRAFAKKLVLTRRIRWVEGSTGSPSFNHAWFIWDWKNQNPPVLAYD